jgi:hypothetical protein
MSRNYVIPESKHVPKSDPNFKWVDNLWQYSNLRSDKSNSVQGVFFHPFPAYCKIYHPIYEDPTISDWLRVWEDADASRPLHDLYRRGGIRNHSPWKRLFWRDLAKRCDVDFSPDLSLKHLQRSVVWPKKTWVAKKIPRAA